MESTLALRSLPGIHFSIKIAEKMARRAITIAMMVVLDAVVIAVMGPNNFNFELVLHIVTHTIESYQNIKYIVDWHDACLGSLQ